MSKQHGGETRLARMGFGGGVVSCSIMASAQQPLCRRRAAGAVVPPQVAAPQATTGKITPEQARQLFSLVDELIKFSSDETGLPIKSTVKRQITSRAAVESYLKEKFEEDESAKRMQRSEIVLKKFGLLDRDFALKPFLLALLKEQIEAYYDSKTKTVYMLDWVDIEEQKPVLAHELTHALQDQHSDLEKWNDQTPDDVSLNSPDDTDHLAKDEMDTAREAVVSVIVILPVAHFGRGPHVIAHDVSAHARADALLTLADVAAAGHANPGHILVRVVNNPIAIVVNAVSKSRAWGRPN